MGEGGGGERFSKSFPTEEDRVNCPFYFKIGACRNGDRCNRAHCRPQRSQTLLLPHMYPNIPESLAISNDEDWDDDTYEKAQAHVELFYEEVFLELATYGEIEDFVVLDNVSDHMVGNVYCKYYSEDSAMKAQKGLGGRFFGARLIQAEFTPVTDFREARCRAFHETRCARGGLCNFMHIKHIPRAIKRRVLREMYEEHPEYTGPNRYNKAEKDRTSRSRSRRSRFAASKKRQTSEERRAMIADWNREMMHEAQAKAAGGVPALGQLPF
eukprot:TRINITY_DN5752_c0_g1_i1.p1 TRINITY_DN5752_c0_g1~~TRINITY_DN5752_c0_g1_i1.p1  ORF type:complete len:269 (-),score=59.39 TRINITY_DN5752_c0_g1_i1:175-981(-)